MRFLCYFSKLWHHSADISRRIQLLPRLRVQVYWNRFESVLLYTLSRQSWMPKLTNQLQNKTKKWCSSELLEMNYWLKTRDNFQGGLECYIYRNKDFVKKFHVKIHTRLANWHRNKGCDLRELFSYKLLETIDVGPKVHFIPNLHHSGFGLYIASEDSESIC